MSDFAWNSFALIGLAQTAVFTLAALGMIAIILKPDKRVVTTTEGAPDATATTA